MNILFRADSSSSIGTGHIMRDLVLAKQYKQKNNNIIFATQNLPNNINNKIEDAGYKVKNLLSNNVVEIIELINLYKIDLLVIDHYGIDIKYETKIKDDTNIKILSFDGTYRKHNCDILLNHNVCGKKEKYKSLVPKNCEIRCGKEFTLIRDEFQIEKNKPKIKANKPSVLVAIGGSDSTNINTKILDILNTFKNISIDVVTTNANANLKELQIYCHDKDNINLHINTTNMAKLIYNSNFAIITPSVTANEIIFMETKFIAIKTVENQHEMYQYLLENNFSVLETFNKKRLTKEVNKMLQELQ